MGSGCRGARGRRLGEQLADVAHLRRERLGTLVAEQPAELLQVRAAARRVDDDEVDVVERVDQPARERLALVEPARVHRERAAAALRRRDDLEAVGGEDARGRRVDVREDGALDAAGEEADPPASRADRGRQRAEPRRGRASAARSPRADGTASAAARPARAARAGAPPACGRGRGGGGRGARARGDRRAIARAPPRRPRACSRSAGRSARPTGTTRRTPCSRGSGRSAARPSRSARSCRRGARP